MCPAKNLISFFALCAVDLQYPSVNLKYHNFYIDLQKQKTPGPGCSELLMSLVNAASLKFQTLISDICQYFWLKK